MDRRKYRYMALIVLLITMWLTTEIFADEFKKPLFQLPEVDIVGEQDTEEIFSSTKPRPADFNLNFNDKDKAKEESKGFVSGAYGKFESKFFELVQSWKTEKFYSSSHLKIEESEGSRDNNKFTVYRPNFSFGLPFDEENEFTMDVDYFDKDMELPGPVESPTLNETRRNTDVKVSSAFQHNFEDDSTLKIKPYYEQAAFNDHVGREDFKNRILGVHTEIMVEENTFNFDLYQNRLMRYYERAIFDSKIRLRAIELGDKLSFIIGSNIFAQEKFGQRPAPYFEFIFAENKDCLHKLIITRNFFPLIFSDVYLEENYLEVNTSVFRPIRKSEISYSLDRYISQQWRMNASVYLRQDKDSWTLADYDADGLYMPSTIEKINISGIKISTEYTWSEAFNNFFSIDIKKIESKDPNFEFIPYEPRHQISAGLAYKFSNRYKLDFVGDYFGRRYYKPNSKASSNPYFLLHSKLTCELRDYLTFFVLVDNLLNDHYEVVKGYPNQSRNILSGVTVKF